MKYQAMMDNAGRFAVSLIGTGGVGLRVLRLAGRRANPGQLLCDAQIILEKVEASIPSSLILFPFMVCSPRDADSTLVFRLGEGVRSISVCEGAKLLQVPVYWSS